MRSWCVPNIIQGTIYPISQLITKNVTGIRETLGSRQTVLPKEIVTDVMCRGARIFQTPREVSPTGRDGSTLWDVNTAVETARFTTPSPCFNNTSNSPTRNGNQDIVSQRRSIIAIKARNAKPLDTPINQNSAVLGHSTSIFSKVIGPKTVSEKVSDAYARIRMDLASNHVVAESLNFMGFRLSPVNTTKKTSPSSAPLPELKG